MTMTSEERREVAERLREYSNDMLKDGSLLKTLKDVTGAGSWRYVLDSLADLIDPMCVYEPTETLTRWDENDQELETNEPDPDCVTFACSRCGYEMLYGDEYGWFDTEPPYAPHFKFCPHCGARVVRDDGK